jgi:hypothetical protein
LPAINPDFFPAHFWADKKQARFYQKARLLFEIAGGLFIFATRAFWEKQTQVCGFGNGTIKN